MDQSKEKKYRVSAQLRDAEFFGRYFETEASAQHMYTHWCASYPGHEIEFAERVDENWVVRQLRESRPI